MILMIQDPGSIEMDELTDIGHYVTFVMADQVTNLHHSSTSMSVLRRSWSSKLMLGATQGS